MPHDHPGPHPGRVDAHRQGWQVVDVPRAYHDSFPADQRPKLRPTWDIFGWSFLLITVVGLCAAVLVPVGMSLFPGPDVVALAAGYGALFIIVTWFLLSRLLIYRGTPRLLAAAAILWGMTGAFVLGAFTVSERLITLAYSWEVDQIAFSLGGAYPEELSKALGVWLLLHLGRAWWNRPWHGLVAGMLIGFGFEAFENMGYAVMLAIFHPTSDLAGASEMWLFRLIAGPGLHAVCTGLVGYGIGMAVFAHGLGWRRRLWWILSTGFAGFLVHALWNLQLESIAATLAVLVVAWGGGAALLVVFIVTSTRTARALAAEGLYPAVSVYQRVPRQPVSTPVAGPPAAGPEPWPNNRP